MKVPGTIAHVLAQKAKPALWSVTPETTVFDAVKLMDEKNVGALPVVEEGRIVGVFSERDYTRKVILRGKTSRDTMVREIMASPAVVATPKSTIDECMRLMTEKRVRHLPIVEGSAIIGIVSIGDLVNWLISAESAAIDNLEGYISGRYPG